MIISVASGKGGTGKTLVATSLALSLKDRGKVQLLDCDVEEPNCHIFLKPVFMQTEPVCIKVPKIDDSRCTYCGECGKVCAYKAIAVLPQHVLVFSNLCHGCGACSYLCPEKAISEENRGIGVVESGYSAGIDFVHGKLTVGEAMATPVIRKVKEKISEKSIAIIDVSPGTSCPVVESIKKTDFCLLVTEPTPFGVNDLALAVETVRMLKIPCGVIINRAGSSYREVEEYCQRSMIPILLSIPFDREIANLYSKGITLVQGIPQWRQSFIDVFDMIRELVSERSCSY